MATRRERSVKHTKSLDDLERLMRPELFVGESAESARRHSGVQPPRRRNSHYQDAASGVDAADRAQKNRVPSLRDDLSSSSHHRSTQRRSSSGGYENSKGSNQSGSEFRPDADIRIDDLKVPHNKKNLKLKPAKRRSSTSSYQSADQGSYDNLNQSMDMSDLAGGGPQSGIHDHRSSQTLPFHNVVKTEREKKRKHQIKTDQLIESIVWFSFHIPRTVLEDLIAHELELWRRNNAIKRSSRRTAATSQRRKGESSISMTSGQSTGSEGSVSSLSDEGEGPPEAPGASHSEKLIRREQHGGHNSSDMIRLPKAVGRDSAILFVDMSGFTKLSTILDVESLSKVINSYFDMIVSEVILFGGDILKFAGDAFFAEWRVIEDEAIEESKGEASNPLSELNASLVSMNEMVWDDIDVPPLSNCVMMAARCAASIVKKFSDYHVSTADSRNTNQAMLNVHCGIGVGQMVGLHVRDYKEGQEEEAVELRREFLLLGEPIDQVSKAADAAKDGEVLASPEAILSLAFCCDLSESQRLATEPICIASRDECFLKFDAVDHSPGNAAMQPYESLRTHCKALNHDALQRLNLQMALYVHPVIRADELALSTAIQAGKISQPTETLESRHRAEAELRSVYTMFITPMIEPRITGRKEMDEELYAMLADIMWVTSRELDRYSGHLRQFIVDDKGVVLIATFGLRGSTFPNMVENNCLPATFAIHRALKSELKVESRIGATFGKVYCGVVGGVRRHEFACMGAPVNLAARLMGSKVNNGILVDEAVHEQCRGRYTFKSLPPVKAKGYDKPVPILEPIAESAQSPKKKKSSVSFIGRKSEKRAILSIAQGILEEPAGSQSSMIFLTGESGIGKSALAMNIMEEMKRKSLDENNLIVTARSTSTETEQKIPLSSYRKILVSVIRDRCDYNAEQPSRSGSGSIVDDSERRSHSRRTRMLVSKMTADKVEDREGRFRRGSNLGESLTQSLHGSVNRSLHGGKKKTTSPKSRQLDPLSQSLHRAAAPLDQTRTQNLHGLRMAPIRTQSMRMYLPKNSSRTHRDDGSSGSGDTTSVHKQSSTVQYFEQLCWACEELDYPYEYADIVGSQFLGFEAATPITHVDGHIPTMDELVEFLALVFIRIVDFAHLTTIFLDDFQWLDAFSWRIFRVICSRAGKTLLICATRSHDKQALRRIMSATTPDSRFQSQMIEISLGPLDFVDIRDLMANFMVHKKSAISDSLCSDIFQRTGGLPVYVVQLLENIKRMRTLELVDGELQWNAEGLKQKKNVDSSTSGAVMEETFLSRFDALDVRVRKVLQTCAVWGLSFQLSDVIQVHPEMEESDIESSLESAIEEMILVEQVTDDDVSVRSGSDSESTIDRFGTRSAGSGTGQLEGGERYFQFSHAMWRKNVLATMLKERKIEIHRLIAESIEKGNGLLLEESDISRLLTLFDHWKACGDFCKVAPLALAVGARLEEWDLSSQSLELYEDALEMVFDGVETTDQEPTVSKDWVRVKARTTVLDLILRLHICIGLCHQRLGEDGQSILFFEDAYKIIMTVSKLSGVSKSLTIPIISSLCVLKLEAESPGEEETIPLETMIDHFVAKAKDDGTPVHIGRSLAMKAVYQAKMGMLAEAVGTVSELDERYDIERSTTGMVTEYGRDYAIECLALSVQWLYLLGRFDEAEKRGERIVHNFLGLLDPGDVDFMMHVVLPIIQVFSLVERAKTADWILKKYVINPYHDFHVSSAFWAPLFNPLAYLLELTIMDEANEQDDVVLDDLEEWVLDEKNCLYDTELEPTAFTIIGEICWRLLRFKRASDATRDALLQKARDVLSPVAHYEQHDLFLKSAAQALLDALD